MLAVGVLGGCKTKEMKSTPFYEGDEVAYAGDTSERVNLWPVAFWRNPVGSVAWPIVSFSDDHLAVRPVYSQYKQSGKDGAWDEFNFVWPIFQSDTRNNTSRIFPVYWDGITMPSFRFGITAAPRTRGRSTRWRDLRVRAGKRTPIGVRGRFRFGTRTTRGCSRRSSTDRPETRIGSFRSGTGAKRPLFRRSMRRA